MHRLFFPSLRRPDFQLAVSPPGLTPLVAASVLPPALPVRVFIDALVENIQHEPYGR
jgi:hypothetical protein